MLSSPRPEHPVLDRVMLDQLRALDDGAGGLLRELVELFRSSIEGYLNQLEDAMAGSDAEAARRAAHAISGMSANLGAADLARTAGLIEDRARAGIVAPKPDSDLRALSAAALIALDEEIRSSDAASTSASTGSQPR